MRQFTRTIILVFGMLLIGAISIFFAFPVHTLFENDRVVDTRVWTTFNPYGLLIFLLMIPLYVWYYYNFTFEDDFVSWLLSVFRQLEITT